MGRQRRTLIRLTSSGLPRLFSRSARSSGVRKAYEFINALQATGVRPDTGYVVAWDPAVLVVEAYRKLGVNATAPQIREYLANLRGWTGILGTYDFRAIPQRGVGVNNTVVMRWDTPKDSFLAVSKLGGEPVR